MQTAVSTLFAAAGLTPTLGALLGLIVLTLRLRATLLMAAMNFVGI